jgi:hypothetical protein
MILPIRVQRALERTEDKRVEGVLLGATRRVGGADAGWGGAVVSGDDGVVGAGNSRDDAGVDAARLIAHSERLELERNAGRGQMDGAAGEASRPVECRAMVVGW